MPNVRWLLAIITFVHRLVYRLSAGRLGRMLGRRSMLLLVTVGRKTGQRRVTPLLYVEDGACLVIVASNAGDDRNPAWWLNLQARPEAEVQVGASQFPVRARRATPEEEQRLWPLLEASYGRYASYRTRTRREIPIVVLERRTSDRASEPSAA